MTWEWYNFGNKAYIEMNYLTLLDKDTKTAYSKINIIYNHRGKSLKLNTHLVQLFKLTTGETKVFDSADTAVLNGNEPTNTQVIES